MTKKQIIIVLLGIALIVGAAAFYLIYFKKLPVIPFLQPSGKTTREAPISGGAIPQNEKLAKISAGGAVSPVTTHNGDHIQYIGKTGDIYEVGFDGSAVKKTPFTPLHNLIKVLWAKDRATFIAVYANPEGKKFFYYDLEKKQASPFAAAIDAISFSGTNNTIAYHSSEGLTGTSIIAVADPDGKNAKTILQSRIRGIDLSWISQNEIVVSTVPSGIAPNMLWVLNTTSQKLSSVLSDMYGLMTQWAASGERFLFAQTNAQGKNLTLSLSDKNGTTIKPLAIVTLPEKCVFAHDEKSVVCAVPGTLPDLVWPDDYYKKLYTAQEQIWRVDLTTGKKDMLYEFPSALFDASALTLSPSEDALVFVNRKDGELYRLVIK